MPEEAYSPPAWTTLSTGKSLKKHGITDFVTIDFSKPGPLVPEPITADKVKSKRIWEIINYWGKRTVIYEWLLKKTFNFKDEASFRWRHLYFKVLQKF